MTSTTTAPKVLTRLDTALEALAARLEPVDTERVELAHAKGRVLAENVCADPSSPPVDVSAMDGVAIRVKDAAALAREGLPIIGEAVIGAPTKAIPPGAAMWIFTGGPVPAGADAVVKREDIEVTANTALLGEGVKSDSIRIGQHIRRAGENAQVGDVVAKTGSIITPALLGVLASVGAVQPRVRRRVRVAILVTGDEVVAASGAPSPTGLRDSNGPAIGALLGAKRWIEVVSSGRVRDSAAEISAAIAAGAQRADCVITTGGVSMGLHDYVPDVVSALGGETVFHWLAIKPGRPMFAATLPDRTLALGLPGNPVSALLTARRIALAALAQQAGAPEKCVGPDARVVLDNSNDRAMSLLHFRLVHRTSPDRARLVQSMGSGDLASAAASSGFIDVPTGASSAGPFDYYDWSGA